MEVILREAVDALGRVGDVVNVKPGYARNFLIPNRLAYVANAANKKRLEVERHALEAKQATQRSEAEQIAEKIQAVTLTISKEAGEENKLYGSVTAHDVAVGLAEAGITVDRKKIDFSDAIRSLGEFEVDIRINSGVTAKCKLNVVKA